MRELRQQAKPILRVICLILAGLVLYQLAGVFIRWNPFRGVTVPQLPSLVASTNSPAVKERGTNAVSVAGVKGTNGLPHASATNAAVGVATNINSNPTNSTLTATALNPVTNSITHSELALTSTNVPVKLEEKLNGTNISSTTSRPGDGTNQLVAGTNAAPSTNQPIKIASASPAPPVMGMNPHASFPPGVSTGKRDGDIPPAMQMRIDRVTESEILGPVMHPLPMGLLGIAGEFAFLRSANGQTGLVKEGDSLGDLKLLRIGTNRVLIEQDGQKKELMIFSGTGGESLLPKQKDDSDENKHP